MELQTKLQLKIARLTVLNIAMNEIEDKKSDDYKLCHEKYTEVSKEINEIEDIFNKNLTKQEEFDALAKPLIKFINDNYHPHVSMIIDGIHAEVLEGVMVVSTDEFVKD